MLTTNHILSGRREHVSFRACMFCHNIRIYPYLGFMTGQQYQCQDCEEISPLVLNLILRRIFLIFCSNSKRSEYHGCIIALVVGYGCPHGKIKGRFSGAMGVIPDLMAFVPVMIISVFTGHRNPSVDDTTRTEDFIHCHGKFISGATVL